VLTSVLLVALILAVGTHLADTVRLRQEEIILRKLTVEEAHAYYELLRQRVRRVRILRAATVVSLAVILMAARRRFFPKAVARSARPGQPPISTEDARVIAVEELSRFAARELMDRDALKLVGVTHDAAHPWVFDYAVPRSLDRVRISVDRAGRASLQRISKP
jgi:hypothetical protein